MPSARGRDRSSSWVHGGYRRTSGDDGCAPAAPVTLLRGCEHSCDGHDHQHHAHDDERDGVPTDAHPVRPMSPSTCAEERIVRDGLLLATAPFAGAEPKAPRTAQSDAERNEASHSTRMMPPPSRLGRPAITTPCLETVRLVVAVVGGLARCGPRSASFGLLRSARMAHVWPERRCGRARADSARSGQSVSAPAMTAHRGSRAIAIDDR